MDSPTKKQKKDTYKPTLKSGTNGKKKELPKILATVKKYKAILYFEDESSIYLSPALGKTWSPKGITPIISVTGKREKISAMSAISKTGHLVFKLHKKNIASDEIINFLDQLLKEHPRRHLVVVMDKARPHTSKKTCNFIEKQKRLHVFYFPPYSPDLNPDEKVWNYLKNHAMQAHRASSKEDLLKLTGEKLEAIASDKKLVKGILWRSDLAKSLR